MLTYRFSQRLWPVRYDWAPTIRMGGAAIMIVLISGLFPELALPASIALHAVMMLGYLLFLWTAGPLSPAHKQSLLLQARRMIRRPGTALP